MTKSERANWEVKCTRRIKVQEGLVLQTYPDQKNIPSFGYGTNLTIPFSTAEREFIFSHLFDPMGIASFLFDSKFDACKLIVGGILERQCYLVFADIPDNAKIALVDMAYNMGGGALAKFAEMFKFIAVSDWGKSADECMDSIYGRDKFSKNRASSNADLLRSCAG